MKKINLSLPLAALILGIGLVFTQSAFTGAQEKSLTTEYVLTPTGWELASNYTFGNEEGNYNCTEEFEKICSGYFVTPPTDPSDEPLLSGRRTGEFYIVEQ